jgi:hypothetical protein
MTVFKRVIVGFIWCFVLYFAACFIAGAIAGWIAGARDPVHGSTVGAQSGRQIVETLWGNFAIGAIVPSISGTWAGVLPGTRKKVLAEPPA